VVTPPRVGRSRLGCLVAALLLAAVVYFGFGAAEAYWRYLEFRDAMAQEARFAARLPDDSIAVHLRAKAESLGLPDRAGAVGVRRRGQTITIWSEYHELLELPGTTRRIRFAPRVVRDF
jgi:hypothetical protein